MAELYIDPSNYEYWTGAGNESVVFDGQVRYLNATPPKQPYGLVEGVQAIEAVVPLIPRAEWQDRIKEKDANGSWLDELCKEIKCKDQDSLGFCHAYGTVSAIESCRAVQGLPYIELSAESVGGLVTNWRNAGADPEDDLAVAVKYGACHQASMDKPNSLRPGSWKQGWQQEALEHRVLEWYDLRVPGKTFDAVMTCALLDFGVGLGYAWWSHFVTGVYRARWNQTKKCYDIKERNSWGASYGENGYFWLPEGDGRGQGTPDWAFGVRATVGSEH